MFMFANLSSDGTVDPVPVAVIADEAWTPRPLRTWRRRFARRATISCSRSTSATTQPMRTVRLRPARSRASIQSTTQAHPSSHCYRATTARAHHRCSPIAASWRRWQARIQNAELMSQIAQDNPAALADPEAVARALSLEGGTRRVSLTRTTPDGTVIYYYALLAWSR
ncbi:MAG: hypothetical protein ACLU37_07875 [Collinsella sp.]